MQKLELVVRCETWEDAKNILASVGVYEKLKTNYRPISGLYIVSTELEQNLDSEGYRKIKDNEYIAILNDSESLKRAREILKKIYEVETQIRKLLLHVSDSIGPFFELFYQTSEYTRNFSNEKGIVTCKGKLDPLTSHLTFGEMMDILGYDLSWTARALKSNDLNELVASSTDFEDFKSKMNEKIQPLFVWDIISKEVLKKPLSWPSAQKRLNDLKAVRNKFAHHHVITEKEKKELLKNADRLLKDITPTKPLSTADLATLRKSSEQITRTLELFTKNIDVSAFQAFARQQSEIAAQLRAITGPSIDVIGAFAQANSVAFEGVADAIKGLQEGWLRTSSGHIESDRSNTNLTEDGDDDSPKDKDDDGIPDKEKPKK
jgi:hypothetical protein